MTGLVHKTFERKLWNLKEAIQYVVDQLNSKQAKLLRLEVKSKQMKKQLRHLEKEIKSKHLEGARLWVPPNKPKNMETKATKTSSGMQYCHGNQGNDANASNATCGLPSTTRGPPS